MINVSIVGVAIISHPFGNGLCQLSKVIWGWFTIGLPTLMCFSSGSEIPVSAIGPLPLRISCRVQAKPLARPWSSRLRAISKKANGTLQRQRPKPADVCACRQRLAALLHVSCFILRCVTCSVLERKQLVDFRNYIVTTAFGLKLSNALA